MEAVIFAGLQAAGKSTFYWERFFATHVRINLDMLRTRRREELLLRCCLEMQQPFVVDNTNPTAADRARYISAAHAAGFRVVGYSFAAPVADCIARNAARPPHERIPVAGIYSANKRFAPLTLAEGFDALYVVRTGVAGAFTVEEWTGDTA
ncbi:MAG: AAA family ATPase [Thermomicrobiales bacterium]